MFRIWAIISAASSGFPKNRLSRGISMLASFSCPDTRMILIGGQRLMHGVGELQSVHTAGHLDVGEQQRDVGSGFENGDSLVGIHRLNRGITGVFHHIDRAHPQQHFVLDDENDGGNQQNDPEPS
jgi:hypothetical protein